MSKIMPIRRYVMVSPRGIRGPKTFRSRAAAYPASGATPAGRAVSGGAGGRSARFFERADPP